MSRALNSPAWPGVVPQKVKEVPLSTSDHFTVGNRVFQPSVTARAPLTSDGSEEAIWSFMALYSSVLPHIERGPRGSVLPNT